MMTRSKITIECQKNYGSRRGYSIETSILEKILTHDNSTFNDDVNTHVISDL